MQRHEAISVLLQAPPLHVQELGTQYWQALYCKYAFCSFGSQDISRQGVKFAGAVGCFQAVLGDSW